jgi:hypothetical protein
MHPVVAAGVVAATLAAVSPAFAQGKSQQKNKTSAPPSRNELAVTAVAAPAPTGATPMAWIDDGSLIAPGTVVLSISAARWNGTGISEVDVPVVDAAFGLASRVQLAMSVPRVVGSSDPGGAAGGIGTSFFSAKVAAYQNESQTFRVAATPTMQLLGKGVVAALGPGTNRVRWGLPISAETSVGVLRVYGGGGYFSPGLWFSGAAAAAPITERVFVSAGFSRAWRRSDIPDVPLSSRDRKELSGGAAYVATPLVTLYGSISRTVATLEENGAGTSVVGGVSFTFATAASRP